MQGTLYVPNRQERYVQHTIPGLAAVFRQNAQKGIGLRFIVQIQAQDYVIASLNARCLRTVERQPADQIEMRTAMPYLADTHRGYCNYASVNCKNFACCKFSSDSI